MLLFFICFLAFAYYLRLIALNSNVYFGDAIIRLAFSDQLLVGRWLPALQAAIIVVQSLTDELAPMRVVLAAFGIAAILASYALASRLFSPLVGLIAAALLSTNVMFVSLAIVPYPEVLFMAFIFCGLFFLDRPTTRLRFYAGVFFVAAACLTRYEGWILAAILVAEGIGESWRYGGWRATTRRLPRDALLFGSVALVWLLLGQAQAQSGEADILQRLNLSHLTGFLDQYVDLLRWQAGLAIIGFGTVGWVLTRFSPKGRPTHNRILAFVVLDILLIALVQPWSAGNLRQTFVLLVFLHLYAAFGLVQIVAWCTDWLSIRTKLGWWAQRLGWVPLAVAGAFAVYATSFTSSFVADSSRQPAFYGAELAGRWLQDRPLEDAAVLALTDDAVQPFAIAAYAGRAPDSVLADDLLGAAAIRARLKATSLVYVLAVQTNDSGLSSDERELLRQLESGSIPAQRFTIGPARAWIVPTDALP